MKTENIALITSTIHPDPNVYLLKRANPEERLIDYQNAFRFYCTKLTAGVFQSMVYVDNSGYPLDSLKNIASQNNCADRVEFISYSSTVDPNNSRFYLEMNLIDQGIRSSEKIRNAKNSFIWKITGRYIIKNIGKIVSASPSDTDMYINCRDFPYKILDFFLVGFSAENYYSLLGNDIDKYRSTEDGELLFRKRIDNGDLHSFKITKRFFITPRVIGVRGYDAQSYNSLSNNVKYYIRVLMSRFLPQIWI